MYWSVLSKLLYKYYSWQIQKDVKREEMWWKNKFRKSISEIWLHLAEGLYVGLYKSWKLTPSEMSYVCQVYEIQYFSKMVSLKIINVFNNISSGRRGRDRMIVWFTISAYHHYSCEFEPRSWRGVIDTTLCDKVCHWLAAGRWLSLLLPFPPPIKLNATIQLKYCWKWR